MTDLTYVQLDEMLRALGFSVRTADPHTKIYNHAGTGALLVLPTPSEKRVIPHHLVATRMTLDGFGIASPPEFTAQLQVG